jgi:hypothetical protein
MLTVYGASDDLIAVEGDIEEEFPWQKRGYGQASGDLLAFSDGTVLRVEFTRSGVWRIQRLAGDPEALHIEQAPEDDENNCSDRATLDGDIHWVVQGMSWARVGA